MDDLERALEEVRRYGPDGLYLLKSQPGMRSRAWVPVLSGEQLEQAFPRAALMNHHDAVVRAVDDVYEQVRNSVRVDVNGNPWTWTWPSTWDVATQILKQIEVDQATAP